jgi:uncharacterized protein
MLHRLRRFAFALALAPVALCAGCEDSEAAPNVPDMPDVPNARFTVRETVEQLHVTHATPGQLLVLHDAAGSPLLTGTADKLGSLIFRKVPAGAGYVIRTGNAAGDEHTRPLRVLSVAESLPPQSFYTDQRLSPGYNYITTRDGTTLSAYVTLPGPPEAGPYPTVVNYSGYDPSKPGEPVSGGKYSFLCGTIPTLCDAPSDPSGLIASLFGFATVSVNMRGTGCSGGAYDYFEPLQLLDGYDVVEAVAAQDWVMHHKVGMTGLSYPGITQLFVASVQPPSLAAITPLSVIGNTATTLFPGGILNTGFAVSWVTNVLDGADPYGQGWEQKQVDAGDQTCAENQLLHGQKVDNVSQAIDTKFYVPSLHDPVNPARFVDRISVPVFLAGAFQDEQTGPFFTTLIARMKAAPALRATVYNGVHEDGFSPQVLAEWKAFLDLFVARRVPFMDKAVRDLAPLLFSSVYGASIDFPPDRFAATATYEEALAAWKAEPRVRVIFESGAGGAVLGAPEGTFEASFSQWPPAETQLLRLFLQPDGSLADAAPQDPSAASLFQVDPAAGDRGILAPKADVNDLLPDYAWAPPAPAMAASFLTEAFPADTTFVGTASADLWVRTTVSDADLQVNVTEVRPDGKEMFVQSGWLRASRRALAADSTPLAPEITDEEKDFRPLVPGEWTSVRVPIAGFNHVFRAGSRLRFYIDTPGGSRAAWRFEIQPFPGAGTVSHAIGHSSEHPSSVALPMIPSFKVPSKLPPCPSLRGQPCRDFAPYANTAAQ